MRGVSECVRVCVCDLLQVGPLDLSQFLRDGNYGITVANSNKQNDE